MFGVDPGYIERAPLSHIAFWHRRAFLFSQSQADAKARQAEFDQQIGAAVNHLR